MDEASMRALVKEGRSVGVLAVPRPRIAAPDDVLLRVEIAGVCRTDVYVAGGRLPSRDPVILGHELAGVVEDTGAGVRDVARGERVTVMPLLPSGEMLGVDRHGAFAEYVVVPASAVYRLPASLSFRVGAYIEPIAAALAVLKAGLSPASRGLVYGRGRIARLTHMVLVAHGFADVAIGVGGEHDAAALDRGGFDFVIETEASAGAMRDVLRAVRAGGKVVLKSRAPEPVAIDVRAAIEKEVTFQAVRYGSFDDAIALVATGRLDVSELLGSIHPLSDFEGVFAASASREADKRFFACAD